MRFVLNQCLTANISRPDGSGATPASRQPADQVLIGGCGSVGSSIGACSGSGILSGGGSFSGLGGGMSGSGVEWACWAGLSCAVRVIALSSLIKYNNAKNHRDSSHIGRVWE